MDNNTSKVKKVALKILRRSFLILLILVGFFTLFYGISMHSMQMKQISKAGKLIDSGEMGELYHLVKKDMIITQGFFYLSFVISVSCLIMIIVYLTISLEIAKRKLKSKQTESKVKSNGTCT